MRDRHDAARTVRVALAIDVEPVPRLPTSGKDSDWNGLRASIRLVRLLRERLSRTQATVPAFTWLVRMDQQIRRVYGHCGWIAERFAAELDDLERHGDDVGLHTHLFRWDERASAWVTDYECLDWMRLCVEEAVHAFRASRGRAPRFHSFGDRYLSEEAVAVLEELGLAADMSVEPGFFAIDTMRPGETLLGRMPDFTHAPRSVWRPSHDNYLQHDAHGRRLRLLPVTTYRFPWWLEPGRQIEHLLRRARGTPPGGDERLQRYARLGCSQRRYVFRQGARSAMADGISMMHLVLRADQAIDAAAFDRIVTNLEWLAAGGLGTCAEFVSTAGLLAAVDGESS
ncbi:MAG TPA: hypothetical protein VEC57_10185 [Candidatus Limnocylindrales bacterium]|nr:hypothetical protein [Candidatus Limnocylindrales bacterium]